MDNTPRMRMFAGPNGSGKSTLKEIIAPELLGVYINADEIEQRLREDRLNFSDYLLTVQPDELHQHFQSSTVLNQDSTRGIQLQENCLMVDQLPAMSYVAAVTADFIRLLLLENRISFSFETVMSHYSKIELLKQAQALGFRTYLYFVATDDPAINVSRVNLRVFRGGHDVPEIKIRERYSRSLDLLWGAIQHSHRAYVFDNSQEGISPTWLAEVTNGVEFEVKGNSLPAWFQRAVWNKILHFYELLP